MVLIHAINNSIVQGRILPQKGSEGVPVFSNLPPSIFMSEIMGIPNIFVD
jgi:hypothetical protein